MPSSSVDGDDLHLLVADRSVGVTVCVIMCDAFKRLHKHDPGEQIFLFALTITDVGFHHTYQLTGHTDLSLMLYSIRHQL